MGTLRAPSTAAALLLSAALTLSAPGAAAAADHSGAAYAALGDSYSSGLGAGDYLDGSGTCRRSANAYPERWAARHEPASFAFAACAGATVPVGRVMSALYGGGLWLWLCAAADSDVAFGPAPPEHQPWLLLLMVMALLLGLMEGMRWHALRTDESGSRRRESVPVRGRFVAAVLSHALPCLALLLADRWQASGVLAGVAAASNLVGRALEQGLYSRASARSLAVTSLA